MHFINELACGSNSILIQLAKMTRWNTAPGPQEVFCVVLHFLSHFKSARPIQHDKSIPKIISRDANGTGGWQEILLVLSLHFIVQY